MFYKVTLVDSEVGHLYWTFVQAESQREAYLKARKQIADIIAAYDDDLTPSEAEEFLDFWEVRGAH